MIILDNSVLSAFTRLGLLDSLKHLFSTAIISRDILSEYSQKWRDAIPEWIQVVQSDRKIFLSNVPSSMSLADASVVKLALRLQKPIASDDRPLRNYAKMLGISVTGSLGLLNLLFKKKIIPTREKYLYYLNLLQEDVYISEEHLRWALEE
ncbi:MAG: hypothetical protein JW891_00275 [Candidatus Lokiarchaeota archaeon]|nr:hypothetical protein [Candidatus Lokiarchaeota archaeon]